MSMESWGNREFPVGNEKRGKRPGVGCLQMVVGFVVVVALIVMLLVVTR